MNMCRLLMRSLAAGICFLVFALHLGCGTMGSPSSTGSGTNVVPNFEEKGEIDTAYHPGDRILIEFADNPGLAPQWQTTVRDDGSINLPLNQTIIAAGKKKAELEEAIQAKYVPQLLRRLTVNVRSEQRSYFVTGEVKIPGQKEHTGLITVMKAVSAAGDFTDYANKRDIDLIRANGQKYKVNGLKALKDPRKYDKPVYPGDIVHVNRRWY